MAQSKYVLGDGEPPEKWLEPWEYQRWRAAVLKDETAPEELLLRLYAEQWEPQECYKAMLHTGSFTRPPRVRKGRQVMIDRATADKRIARAIWVECGRLLLRLMTPEARQHISELSGKMEIAAGIVVYRDKIEDSRA